MKNILYISLMIVVLYGCGRKNANYAAADAEVTGKMSYMEESASADVGSEAGSNDISIEPKIIKSGHIVLETSDAAKTKALINKYIKQFGGWVSEETVSTYDGNVNYALTVRLPAKNFDDMLDSISKSGKNVDERFINSQDVTEEYIDVEVRLKTKKELEARYLELIKKAGKVEEILSIEKEIGILRADIESIEGRLRYMKNAVAYSTLDIRYYVQSQTFGSKLVDAFKTGWHVILSILVFIVKAWAVITIALLLIFIIIRIRRRCKAKRLDQ